MADDTTTQPTTTARDAHAPVHFPTIPVALNETSTTDIAIVPVQQSLTHQEIERICKAFLRLIGTKEEVTSCPVLSRKNTPKKRKTSGM